MLYKRDGIMKRKLLIVVVMMVSLLLVGCVNNKANVEEGGMEYDMVTKSSEEANIKQILGFDLILPDAYSFQSSNQEENGIKTYTIKLLNDNLSVPIIVDSIAGQLPTTFINIDGTFINDYEESNSEYKKIMVSYVEDTDFYTISIEYR